MSPNCACAGGQLGNGDHGSLVFASTGWFPEKTVNGLLPFADAGGGGVSGNAAQGSLAFPDASGTAVSSAGIQYR